MSRRRNTNEFYTARKLKVQIDLFKFLNEEEKQSDRLERRILASRILTFIQNMSFVEFQILKGMYTVNVLNYVIAAVREETIKYLNASDFPEALTVEKLMKEKETRDKVSDVNNQNVSKITEKPRPLIRFDGSTIILDPENSDVTWQWKTKGDEFWMSIEPDTIIDDGVVQVIDQQTLKVSNILDITREIKTMVRQKRREPFKLTNGMEYRTIMDQAKEDILAEIQVQTEEIPVSDVGYSFDTVKKNMKKRIIGNPLLANHVSQLFYDRVTQLIIEGKTTADDMDEADVLRVFPTIMLQPDLMTKEVLEIRKGFKIGKLTPEEIQQRQQQQQQQQQK